MKRIWETQSKRKAMEFFYLQDAVRHCKNFQNVGGKAKPYQVRQLIKIIEKYNLVEEGK